MTRVYKIGPATVLVPEVEPDSACQLCGDVSELRPYGPNGENICFTCGMKDEKTTLAKFTERLEKGDQ